MALPNEIQSGRLNSILHKLLGITEGAPAPSLAPDMFSMICLENDRPEWKFLAGEKLCCSSYLLGAGGAGTFGTHVLWNPTDSGIIAVTKHIHAPDGNARYYSARVTSVDPSALYSSAAAYRGIRDTRWGTAAAAKPTCLHYYLATASPTGTNVLTSFYADIRSEMQEFQVVLGPGTGLVLADQVANETTHIGFMWRERVMERSEYR